MLHTSIVTPSVASKFRLTPRVRDTFSDKIVYLTVLIGCLTSVLALGASTSCTCCTPGKAAIRSSNADRTNAVALVAIRTYRHFAPRALADVANLLLPSPVSVLKVTEAQHSGRAVGVVQTDEQLMLHLMDGDATALEQLVERYHQPLLGYVYRLTNGNYALAEDLVQEIFVRILQQNSYQSHRLFKPWLYAIATNLARDHFRSAAVAYTVPQDEAVLTHADPGPGPEARALAAEQGHAVLQALGQLSPAYRAALLLRFYQGLSLQEIAEVLGVPLGTVKSRLSVGTHQLRDLLSTLKEEPQ